MYVPPIRGSAICVWNAVIPTNCTVLPMSYLLSRKTAKTYLASELSKVVATTKAKYELDTSPCGKLYTTSAATVAITSLATNAYSHGRSTFDSCRPPPDSGLLDTGAGRDHFAASHPATI